MGPDRRAPTSVRDDQRSRARRGRRRSQTLPMSWSKAAQRTSRRRRRRLRNDLLGVLPDVFMAPSGFLREIHGGIELQEHGQHTGIVQPLQPGRRAFRMTCSSWRACGGGMA